MPNNNLSLRERLCSAAIPAVCLFLGIAARVHGLDRDLGTGYRGFDEGLILRYYGDYPLDFIATNYLLGASHHVFHTILIRLMAIGFGGENEIAIRFPAFVFGIACLWMIYQTARQLFGSSVTATIALFLTAILPIHVAWSQTARGYSLTMFLSILMTYSMVRLLESRRHGKWGAALVLSGFLSIYAIPTNIYFAFGLACWAFLVLAIPRWANEYGIDPMLRRRKAALFSVFFLGMVLLSYLAYLPLLDQMIAEAAGEQKFVNENYYGSSSASLILKLIPDILLYIFQGPLKWFLPLVLLGIVYGATARGSYRWLPVLVFLAPFVATLFTGIAGYNRNYLFNLPLLTIFLSAGIAGAGRALEKMIPRRGAYGAVVGGLLALYTLTASFILIKDYYPLTTIKNGKSYKQMTAKQTDSFDLIVIPNINDHLYARSVVKQNLKNIILLNKLSGVKLIASERTLLKEHPAAGGGLDKTFEMFHNRFSLKTLRQKNCPRGLN